MQIQLLLKEKLNVMMLLQRIIHSGLIVIHVRGIFSSLIQTTLGHVFRFSDEIYLKNEKLC